MKGDRFMSPEPIHFGSDQPLKITDEEYQIRVGARCAKCREMFDRKGRCECPKKK